MPQLTATILDSLPDPVVVYDAAWRFVYLNAAAERTTWTPREELLGCVVWDVMPELEDAFGAPYRRAVAERVPVDFEVTTATGTIYHMVALPFDGGLLVRGQDVSVRERARRDEERRLRLITDRAADEIYVCDASGRIHTVNDAACSGTGYTRDELLVLPLWKLAGSGNPLPKLDRVVRTGPITLEGTQRRKDGSTYPIELRLGLIDEGPPARFVAIARDVTERRRLDEALHQSAQRQQALLRRSEELIAVLDGSGVARFVSPSYSRVLQYDPDAMIGRNVLDLLHPEDLPLGQRALEEVLAQPDHTVKFEARALRADGTWRVLEIVGRNALDEPAVRGVVVNARDITERKAAEERTRGLAARLRAVTELASVVVGARTPDELRTAVVNALGQVVSFDFLALALYDRQCDTLAFLAAEDGPHYDPAQTVPVAGTPSERVVRERRPLLTAHADDPAAAGAVLVGSMRRSESIIRVPLLSGGEVLGILSVQSYTPDLYTLEDVEVTQAMASIAATAVEKIRTLAARDAAEAALRLSEERYRQLVEVLPDIMLVEVDDRIVFANPAAERALGGPGHGSLVGRPILDTIDPSEHEGVRQGRKAMREHGAPLPSLMPLRMRALDGRRVDAEISGAVLEFDGRPGTFIVARDQTEHRRAEERIAFQAGLLDTVGQAVVASDLDGRINFWNQAASALFGWSAREAIGVTAQQLGILRADALPGMREDLARGESWSGEVEFIRRDGATVPVLSSLSPVLDADGRVVAAVGVHTDLTQRKQLEEELRQAQKMEAVGRLAGGVAHDFNNVLVAIRGYTELALDALPAETPVHSDLLEVRKGAERAASLTHQLLAFSRKQIMRTRVVELAEVVLDLQKMLRRLIGEDIDLVVEAQPGGTRVEADPSQLEQVLLNLVVNSRDAMPSGGRILISTEAFRIPEDDDGTHAEVPPGRYARLTVTDTGLGMDEQTLAHMFEPFFTTKEQGKGTGLGLAMVYGIVRQSGGHIRVHSEPGQGASFEILLPSVEETVPTRRAPEPEGEPAGRGGTVLLVEDEHAVRGFVRRVLQRRGFQILEANDGIHALEVARATSGPIDLLLTDVVMPGSSGLELARTLAGERAGLKVLYISGYSEEMLSRHGEPDLGAFLTKPFGQRELVEKVLGVLASAAA